MPIAIPPQPRSRRLAAPRLATRPPIIAIALVGPGKVGRALLQQFAAMAPRLRHAPQGVDLRLHAVADSRRMVLEGEPIPAQLACDALCRGNPQQLGRLTGHVRDVGRHALIVDCSGDDAIAARYPAWLDAGIHVVTASKQAGSGPLERHRSIREAMRAGGQFRHEASVGAGLPIIQTLRSLLDTGDELIDVEGVLSGTLAWLFNHYDGTRPFSDLVREAHRLGYTEPDPRDDLSGLDVARKLVILAREAERDMSLGDVAVENLIPPALRCVSREQFMARLHEIDAPMRERLAAAQREGRALRYLARLAANGRASVRLVAPEAGHATLRGRLTDNLIQFRTRRYAENPLVVQGPGAGPEVTAAGVFGDILAIARTLR